MSKRDLENINANIRNASSSLAQQTDQINSSNVMSGINSLMNGINTLIDNSANEKAESLTTDLMSYIINDQDKYMYDTDGSLIKDPNTVISNVNNYANELAESKGGPFKYKVKDKLNSVVSSYSESILSRYATNLTTEREKSVNSTYTSEISLLQSGQYGSAAKLKFETFSKYAYESGDKELIAQAEKIKSIEDGSSEGDIYAEIAYAEFLKSCHVNGMAKSYRLMQYGEDAIKDFYLQSSIAGRVNDNELGVYKNVVENGMSIDEWVSRELQNDSLNGYTIDGVNYKYTQEQLADRESQYRSKATEIYNTTKYEFGLALEKKQKEIDDMASNSPEEFLNFLISLGSEEKMQEWLCQPTYLEAVGKPLEVSMTKGYVKNTGFTETYKPIFTQINYAKELYKWTNSIYSAYGTEDESETLNNIGEFLLENYPDFYTKLTSEDYLGLGDISNTSDDLIKNRNNITVSSIYTLINGSYPNGIKAVSPLAEEKNKNISSRELSAYEFTYSGASSEELKEKAIKSTTGTEQSIFTRAYASSLSEEQTEAKNLNREKFKGVINSIFNDEESYSSLIENNGNRFENIADQYGIKGAEREALWNSLVMDQASIDKQNAEKDKSIKNLEAHNNLIDWYYDGIANGKYYTSEELDSKADELGVDKTSSSYNSFRNSIVASDANRIFDTRKNDQRQLAQEYIGNRLIETGNSYADITDNEIDALGLDDDVAKEYKNYVHAKQIEEEIVNVTETDESNENYRAKKWLIEALEKADGKYNEIDTNEISGLDISKTLQNNLQLIVEENASKERLTEKENAKTEEEKLAEKEKQENITKAKTEIGKDLQEGVNLKYDDAINRLVTAGMSESDAEAYVFNNHNELYELNISEQYESGVQYVLDYVNSGNGYNFEEIKNELVNQGYSDKMLDNLIGLSVILQGGYVNGYSAKDIAGSFLGKNKVVDYIVAQKNYNDVLPSLLLGKDLMDLNKGSERYLDIIKSLLSYEVSQIEELVKDDNGIEKLTKYLSETYGANVDSEIGDMNYEEIAKKYMINADITNYINEYQVFMQTYGDVSYDENNKIKDIFTNSYTEYSANQNLDIHNTRRKNNVEFCFNDDKDFIDCSVGGQKFNKILADVLFAENTSKALSIIQSNKGLCTEETYNLLTDIAQNSSIESLLKAVDYDGDFMSILRSVNGFDEKNTQKFKNFYASNEYAQETLKQAIKKYGGYKSEGNLAAANDTINQAINEIYNKFASDIMSTNVPKGIAGYGESYSNIGDMFSGKSMTNYKDNPQYPNESYEDISFNMFIKKASEINSMTMSTTVSAETEGILTGNRSFINSDYSENVMQIKEFAFNPDVKVSDDMLALYSFAMVLYSRGIDCYIDFNKIADANNNEELKKAKSNIIDAMRDLNEDSGTYDYSSDFLNALNTSAAIYTYLKDCRKYIDIQKDFDESNYFKRIDENGNMETTSGSVISFVSDIMGDTKTFSIEKDGNKIYDVSAHKSGISKTSAANAYGIKFGLFVDQSDFMSEDNFERILKYNTDEYSLKGSSSRLIIPKQISMELKREKYDYIIPSYSSNFDFWTYDELKEYCTKYKIKNTELEKVIKGLGILEDPANKEENNSWIDSTGSIPQNILSNLGRR